jgi:hypothetical protein
MPKPRARANAGPTKSRVQPAVSRKNRAGPKPAPKPTPRPAQKPAQKPGPRPVQKHMPRPRPRPTPRPRPIQKTYNPEENASIQGWLSVQREKERIATEAREAEAKAARNRYQQQVDAELRDYAERSMISYRIQQDPRQQKANEVMREEDPGHVDTIYTEEDLKDIEDMFGPFTNTRPIVNPMQVQSLREIMNQRKVQNQQKKRTGTFRSRKHRGKGTGF